MSISKFTLMIYKHPEIEQGLCHDAPRAIPFEIKLEKQRYQKKNTKDNKANAICHSL